MILNKDLRRRILEMGLKYKHGHYGSSMSCVDVVKFLYDEILTPNDVFIMSKGHGAPALHAVLESKGFPVKWTIHLEYDEVNGISSTSGSLGYGLTIAIGRAYGKLLKNSGRVFCLVGDGELQEGSNWEALNIANRFKLHNLIVLIDWNKYQALDSIKNVMWEDSYSISKKLMAFGCNVIYANGHDYNSLSALKQLYPNTVNAVILDTVKGKGIPVLEKNPSFHVYYFHEHMKDYNEAIEYLQ